MTVLKSKRSLSDMEFFHNALNLRKYVTFRLLKDFGIKPKVWRRTFLINSNDLTDQERQTLGDLLDKTEHVGAIDDYPQWFIETERDIIMKIMADLLHHIVQANTIYISSEATADERRSYQNCAIADCERLIQELSYVISIIPVVDANKLMPLVDQTEREIALLKLWRKSDNKRLRAIHDCGSVANSTNFCNANNNGNAGNNNASNSNGVRPRFHPE